MRWRYGDVRHGYEPGAPESEAAWTRRIAGRVLQSAGALAASIDARLARPASEPEARGGGYQDAILDAVRTAERHARGVVVVLSPVDTEEQAHTRRVVRETLDPIVAADRRLRLVDLSDVAELRDPALRTDGWNYGAQAITLATTRMAPAVLELITQQ
jgi:hypothetical protein